MVRAADAMAERLYKQNSDMFIQKFYNKNFDIILTFELFYDTIRVILRNRFKCIVPFACRPPITIDLRNVCRLSISSLYSPTLC